MTPGPVTGLDQRLGRPALVYNTRRQPTASVWRKLPSKQHDFKGARIHFKRTSCIGFEYSILLKVIRPSSAKLHRIPSPNVWMCGWILLLLSFSTKKINLKKITKKNKKKITGPFSRPSSPSCLWPPPPRPPTRICPSCSPSSSPPTTWLCSAVPTSRTPSPPDS